MPDIADESLLAWREELFALAQDRSKPIELRAAEILQTAGRTLSHHSWAEWAEIYLELERLEPSWTDRLLELKETDLTGISLPDAMAWEPALEQLLVYFLYRQMPLALDDGEYEGRAAFAVRSFAIIRRLLLVHFALQGNIPQKSNIRMKMLKFCYTEYRKYCKESRLLAAFFAFSMYRCRELSGFVCRARTFHAIILPIILY